MNKKLKLNELKVKSFVTSANKKDMETIKGGTDWATGDHEKCRPTYFQGVNTCIAPF